MFDSAIGFFNEGTGVKRGGRVSHHISLFEKFDVKLVKGDDDGRTTTGNKFDIIISKENEKTKRIPF